MRGTESERQAMEHRRRRSEMTERNGRMKRQRKCGTADRRKAVAPGLCILLLFEDCTSADSNGSEYNNYDNDDSD